MIYGYLMIAIIIAERLVELWIAARNEAWMKQHGAIEIGKKHYHYFVLMHVFFFASLLLELQFIHVQFQWALFVTFILAQCCRVWCISALGRFWNTKIIVLKSVAVIKTGPYKYLKHPNYIIVFVELFVLPAIFGAYWTASIFPLLHMSLLAIRIPVEDKALGRN